MLVRRRDCDCLLLAWLAASGGLARHRLSDASAPSPLPLPSPFPFRPHLTCPTTSLPLLARLLPFSLFTLPHAHQSISPTLSFLLSSRFLIPFHSFLHIPLRLSRLITPTVLYDSHTRPSIPLFSV